MAYETELRKATDEGVRRRINQYDAGATIVKLCGHVLALSFGGLILMYYSQSGLLVGVLAGVAWVTVVETAVQLICLAINVASEDWRAENERRVDRRFGL